jgi:predicted nucleotidyltransferase
MPKQPVELMFGAYRRKLLATLLLRPGERFHVRELGRMTGMSAGSIHRELKAMAESGLLLREHAGNQVLYQANQACPVYPELAAIFRKTVGMADLLRGALAGLTGRIEFAFVFGSMASGQQNSASDVDLLILGKASLVKVVKALSPVQASLGREVNPVVMTPDKWMTLLSKSDRFAIRAMDEPKIFVIGCEGEFGKLIKDRSTG